MPRYIDAGALYERTAEWEASALKYIEKLKLNKTPYAEMSAEERVEWVRWTAILGERSAFKHDVADAPTADVVKVVRCKDCKYSHPWYADKRICEMWSETGAGVFNNDYCSRGERREDDAETH